MCCPPACGVKVSYKRRNVSHSAALPRVTEHELLNNALNCGFAVVWPSNEPSNDIDISTTTLVIAIVALGCQAGRAEGVLLEHHMARTTECA